MKTQKELKQLIEEIGIKEILIALEDICYEKGYDYFSGVFRSLINKKLK